MTLGIIWERAINDTTELVVASDSRLSGSGRAWDCNPKILLLPRSDAVISFAGATDDAYPLMIQAINATYMHEPAEKRVLDICEFKGHLLRVFTDTLAHMHSPPSDRVAPDPPDVVFSLSGYSWREGKFCIWKLVFDKHNKKFSFIPAKRTKMRDGTVKKLITIIGDKDAVREAKLRLFGTGPKDYDLRNNNLSMQPFEVLRDIIRSNKFGSVGGAPQIVKIYKHLNSVPVGVRWPDASGKERPTVLGRPLMEYEVNRWATIDPETLAIDDPKPSAEFQ